MVEETKTTGKTTGLIKDWSYCTIGKIPSLGDTIVPDRRDLGHIS